MRGVLASLGIGLIAAAVGGCGPLRPVTTETLLAEMTDLAALAQRPEPPFTCRQFSSYDRKSTRPGVDDWFANADVGQYLRVEEVDGRQERVMMDAAGPGAIVRIWSANPRGTLRIYLDHAKTPALVAPMADVLGGKLPGIPLPIAGTRSHGWNSHFPIPYARHCKVTSDEGGFYYHVNYRTYTNPFTRVISFQPGDLETLKPAIDAVAARLAVPAGGVVEPTTVEGRAALLAPLDPATALRPNEARAFQADGPGAIVAVRARVEAADPDAERTRRQLLLTMTFDGEQTVECPFADFFGAGPGLSHCDSLPMSVAEDGELWSRWFMPYARSAVVQVKNVGEESVKLSVRPITTGYEWTDRSMHFFARWKRIDDVPSRPFIDWNYCTIRGQGVFVGAALEVTNPVRHWWGEGDEKIYVDGETWPSHFGTGTEDYFGYAWCSSGLFTHAYHNQPRCDGPGNYGRSAVNRWHILDQIPFDRDLRFDMEIWHQRDDTTVSMAVATYWYARPGATSEHAALQAVDLRLPPVPPYEPPAVAGAIEGESLPVIEKTGVASPQEILECSSEKHLWWREARIGDRLVITFEAPQARRYRLFGRFLKAADYGVMRLSVGGEPVLGTFDFYNKGIKVSDEIALGVFPLKQGANEFAAEIVGANEEAAPKYMFGLDYLRLEPAE